MTCIAIRALRIGGVISALVAGLAPDASAQPQASTLRLRLGADIRSTDPGVNRDANSDIVVMHMVEGLVAFRDDTSVGPLLAESITKSADGRVYTFKLRHGVKFHNGAPLTAADVLFTWNRYMTPRNNWRCLAEFDGRGGSRVLTVESPDPATVVFTLEKPSALFLTMLARTDCGGSGIYHRSSVGSDGRWLDPVGTGPFKLNVWKRGQFIELARYDGYMALPGKRDGNTGSKTADVAKVRFVIIPDVAAAKAALLSGGIDMLFDVDSEDVPELKARSDIVLATAPAMNLVGMLIQSRSLPLKDVRIRRALAMSLDLPLLVSTVTAGTSHASRSAIPRPSSYFTAAQAEVSGRDLKLARKLLAEGGYRGEPIKLLTTRRYKNLFEIAVLAQGMALEAGINVEIEVLDWVTLLDRYTKGNYQAMVFSYSSRLDPSLSYGMFVGAGDKQTGKVWDDPDAFDLVSRSMSSVDRAERQALFDSLDAKLRQDVPAIFMYSSEKIAATKTYVSGYEGWSLGQPRAWGVTMRTP